MLGTGAALLQTEKNPATRLSGNEQAAPEGGLGVVTCPFGGGLGGFVDDGENLLFHLCCEFLGAGDAR